MKLPNPFKCDYCGALKGAGNGWWMRQAGGEFYAFPWDEGLADGPLIEHICSEACLHKALSLWAQDMRAS